MTVFVDHKHSGRVSLSRFVNEVDMKHFRCTNVLESAHSSVSTVSGIVTRNSGFSG